MTSPFEHAALDAALQEATERGEVAVTFQPRVSLTSGDIVSMEASLRWTADPGAGATPGSTAGLQGGFASAIGQWLVRQACRTAARWRDEGLAFGRIVVDVPGHQLVDPAYALRVLETLSQTGVPAHALGLALSDTAMLQEIGGAAGHLARLREQGVHVSLAGFGRGWSGIGCLARLPVDALKMHAALLPADIGDRDALAVVRALIAMAHCLGLQAVADGVASQAQLEVLSDAGCDAFAGPHFCAPLSASGAGELLRAGRRLPLLERHRAARVRRVVVVDAEPWVARRLAQQLGWRYGDTVQVEAFTDAPAALRRLRDGGVDVVVAALQAGGMSLMEAARDAQPDALRMMLLEPAELSKVVDDPRQVEVFRHVAKPWRGDALFAHFDAALAEVDRRRAARRLALPAPVAAAPAADDAPVIQLLELEAAEPGITRRLSRDEGVDMELPSQLLTLPGDLWTLGTPGSQPCRR